MPNLSLVAAPADAARRPYDPDGTMRGAVRHALVLMAVVVLGAGSAGALIPIGSAVIANGQVGVASLVKHVAHPGGGTVAQILVHNGQHVRKGQALLRLDDQVATAEATMAALSVDQMLAQRARLEAERLGSASIVFPDSLTRSTDPAAAKAMADETRMFALSRSEQAGVRAQLQARIGQYQRQISGFRSQIDALRQQMMLIEPERAGLRDLYEKKLVTLNRLNQLERTAVDFKGSLGSLTAQIAATEARISETREQIIQLAEARRTQAGNEIAQINLQLNQLQSRSVLARDQRERTLVRAPVDGVVEQIRVSTLGGVVRPAEPLFDVVPHKDQLVIEGSVSPTDIDQVRANLPARIRFSTLNNTATPELIGRVVYVGSDPVSDGEGANRHVFFPVRVVLDTKALRATRIVALKPGMPAEIFIETGSRSMLSYLTKPIQDQFARAFRD